METTLAQSSDAIPRVILLGRLCLYGPGAARLHEELVPITARWGDPQVRKAEQALLPQVEQPAWMRDEIESKVTAYALARSIAVFGGEGKRGQKALTRHLRSIKKREVSGR